VENNSFKSTVFGGFNRDDVIRYIEKTALENQSRYDELEKENDGLCRENADLRRDLADAQSERDRLAKQVQDNAGEKEIMQKSLSQAQSELMALREQLIGVQNEKALLQSKIAALEPQVEEFESLKTHITEIELAARQRAAALENNTRAKLSESIELCRKECSYVLSTLGDTCNHVSEELRKSDASLSALPAAFSALRVELDEIAKLGEQ